ncbi:MAG: FlhC family transcriptional regulator [Betaproteobacteria bacterium]
MTHTYELTKNYVCGLCEPPARAGKGKGSARRAEDALGS